MKLTYLSISGAKKVLEINNFECLDNGYFSVEFTEFPGETYFLNDLDRVLSVELI